MTYSEIICPKCNQHIYIKRQNDKGEGAEYAKYITSLQGLRGTIYGILKAHGARTPETAMPKKLIGHLLHEEKGIKASGNSVSGRLSELRGMGRAFFTRQKIIIHRPETEYKPRFEHLPRWYAPIEAQMRLY